MNQETTVRRQVIKVLDWEDAHASFDAAVADIPPELRGVQPAGMPYSLWQMVEHMRLAQLDILEFCVNPNYVESKWPDDYWPSGPVPPADDAWDKSIKDFRRDNEALKKLAEDPKIDLFAKIPHGTGQTYLRELLLAADHNSYHIGQIIVLRRLLDIWKSK
jgi:uncharacterized damage-inducible protein DinB